MTTADSNSDWFLEQLVDWANKTGLGLGLTLNVGGQLISGTTISGAKYFESLAELIEKASGESSSEFRKSFAELIGSYSEIYNEQALKAQIDSTEENKPEQAAESGEESASVWQPPTYIHLSNAQCFYPDAKPLPHNGGTLWRGKISQIEGFSFGLLRAEATDD